ncbi:MAG: DNA polymerase III subunit alpha [Candidatus Peregrinibacteria bacterium]
MSFVNLHTHSHYSLLDGFGSPRDIILRAKELGYPAVALTDHGVTYGLIEFYKEGKKEGIKPILGCEMYVAPRTRFDKEAKIDVKPYHLTVLAKNNEGYYNLLKLVTQANLEGFYYKARVDYGLLRAHSKGLIALSGCIVGHLPRMILSGNEEEIHKTIKQHIDIFGKENYFFEIQDHPLLENQEIVNNRILELSKEYGIDIVATNDTHYPRPEDSEVHDILLCIQTQSTVGMEDRMRYVGDFSIRDSEDIKAAFKNFPGAIENTLKVAEMCNVDFEFGNNLIPSFKTPQNEKPDVYLRQLCEEGLKTRFEGKKIPTEYNERLEYELKTVNKMGFDTYFLIVYDVVRYAKEKDIVVGPGRGSAAGSILAWSLNITDLDPIEHGLFFERFLNPERVSMPDIDIDFADKRRDEILAYVIEKYGQGNVAQIITFGTMAPRAVVRDVGRALGYPYQEVDALAKTVPPPVLGKHVPLKVSIVDDPDLRHSYQNDPRAKALLDYAMRLEGTVRHAGTHACAVVISEKDLTEYTALQYGAGGRGEIVTQYSAKPLEDLGLLKMDFLGLKNLTVIEETCGILHEMKDVTVDISSIPLDDESTFELLKKADTTGVFQLESGGMRRYLKDLKPTRFEDIVAMSALYRPGPMEWIPNYIQGKHHPEKIKYLHKSFKPILESTYGVAVYQEQILQIARDFAGFSLGEADMLRKAVGKKIGSLLSEQREKFIKGAVENGHDETFANEVFEKVIEPFAGYGFNKAHAVCYGLIAYQTAYLKTHYPVEFMTALLRSDANNTDRLVLEMKECSEMGINVLPPSINESSENFTVVDDNKVRFGLLAIKGIGEGPVKEIVDIRSKHGRFKSLEEFSHLVPVRLLNKKIIQALALGGALDEFGDRNAISENYDEIIKFAKLSQAVSMDGQATIFGMMDESDIENDSLILRDTPKATEMQKLKMEKEFLGMYVSGHPLQGLKKYFKKKAHLIGELTVNHTGKRLKICGIISSLKKILTKSGAYMVTFVVEDPTARMNAVIFPKIFNQYGNSLAEDNLVCIDGKLDFRRGQYQLIVDSVKVLSIETIIENAKSLKLYNPGEKDTLVVQDLNDILAEKELLDESAKANIEDFDLGDSDLQKSDSKTFLIKIPKDANAALMESVKLLLSKNKGRTPVEIFLPFAEKKIKLPFGVNLTDKLKEELHSLMGHVLKKD